MPPKPVDREWNQYLKTKAAYRTRNSNCKVLRAYYDGIDYYAQAQMAKYLDSLVTPTSEELESEKIVETGFYLTFNCLNSIVNKFIFQLATVPEIQLAILGDADLEGKRMVDQVEKLIHGVFDLNQMPVVLSNFSFHYSLLGLGTLQALPVKEDHLVDIGNYIPENWYPVLADLDGKRLSRSFYDNIVSEEVAREQFGDKKFVKARFSGDALGVSGEDENDDDQKVRLVVMHDDNRTKVYNADGTVLQAIDHDFGFIPVEWAQAIPRPGRLRGQSIIEQSIGIAQLYSQMLNYQGDIIGYAAAPALDIFGAPKKDPAQIRTGPGAVEQWPAEAKVQFRGAPQIPGDLGQFINNLKQIVREQTETDNPVHGGRSDVRVRSANVLAGLIGSFVQAIGYFQQIIGYKMARLVTHSILMINKTRDGEVGIGGHLKGTPFIVRLDPKVLEQRIFAAVTWPLAQYDYLTRVNIELQKLGAGVQSVYTTMEKLGTRAPLDEAKMIMDWARELEGVRSGIVDMGANRQPGAPPPDNQQLPTQKGTFTPGPGETSPQTAPPEFVRADEIRKLIAELKLPPDHKVFAMGQMVSRGRTGGTIDLGLTHMEDKARILNSPVFAPYKERLRFVRAKKRKSA